MTTELEETVSLAEDMTAELEETVSLAEDMTAELEETVSVKAVSQLGLSLAIRRGHDSRVRGNGLSLAEGNQIYTVEKLKEEYTADIFYVK